MLAVTYSFPLMLASLVVAMLGSYAALGLADRARSSARHLRNAWFLCGSVAMGLGIWSMHFVGMLAVRLPMALGYNVFRPLFSLVMAIVSSAFALWFVRQERFARARLIWGALLMGCGIASMHYIGMDAMLMWPGIVYSWPLVFLSIIVAVGASGAGLAAAVRLHQRPPDAGRLRLAAAIILGGAIAGMHYLGMAAASFPPGSVCVAATTGLSASWLAVLVAGLTTVILAVVLAYEHWRGRLKAPGQTSKTVSRG